MKTQIIRSIFLVTILLLITTNNNAGKLELDHITTMNTVTNLQPPADPAVIMPNEKPNQDEPDIHYHIFDIDKDERITEARKIRARKFFVGLYDILFLAGLHYALYILPWVATHLNH